MPCWEIFENQTEAYQESVLPGSVKARVSVEAGATLGWCRWVGEKGVALGIDRFGASAPYEVNMEKFGLTPGNIAAKVRELLGREL
jgi:transketolase